MLLEGRTAVVVGAGTQGIGVGNGRAAAIAYAREGAHVGALTTTRIPLCRLPR